MQNTESCIYITYDKLGTYICPVAIVGGALYPDGALYPGGARSFPYLNAISRSSSLAGAASPRLRAISLVCFSMKARLYCRSLSLLIFAVSAFGASFGGCNSVAVTPLTSDLACVCHVRGFHQTKGLTAISFHGALVVDVQVDSPIFVYVSVIFKPLFFDVETIVEEVWQYVSKWTARKEAW